MAFRTLLTPSLVRRFGSSSHSPAARPAYSAQKRAWRGTLSVLAHTSIEPKDTRSEAARAPPSELVTSIIKKQPESASAQDRAEPRAETRPT